MSPYFPLNNSYSAILCVLDICKLLAGQYNKRPDLLAHDLYGDSRLWWVFTLFNRQKLRDPVNDFKSGVKLNVPGKSQIERLI